MNLKNLKNFSWITLLFAIFANPAHAADALQKVTSFFEKIEDILRGASIAVVTVAILIVGYQMLFNGKTFRDCFPIMIAALIMGGAAEFARFVMG